MIYSRLSGGDSAPFAAATLAHLEHFAAEGLRTLVFAVADIPEQVYQVRAGPRRPLRPLARIPSHRDLFEQDWSNTYHKASIAIQDREQKIEEAADLVENNLRLLGATAIEDKLQVSVPPNYIQTRSTFVCPREYLFIHFANFCYRVVSPIESTGQLL